MKCQKCHDYNRGVRSGTCSRCSFDRFQDAAHEEAVAFEKKIEQKHRWSDEKARATGANTQLIKDTVKAVFHERAVISKEGSVRKCTEIEGSDLDLMITLSHNSPMTEAQREELAQELRKRTDVFQDVNIAHHAIKCEPHEGAPVDIVAHHSMFCFKYLRPAGDKFWDRSAASLAVSGLKVWWGSRSTREDAGKPIPGTGWEEVVLRSVDPAATPGSETWQSGISETGFAHFLSTLKLLSTNIEVCEGTQIPRRCWDAINDAARNSLLLWADDPDFEVAFGV